MHKEHSTSSLATRPTADLLRRLSSADPGAAWVEFLERYSALIMRAAGQFVYEQERLNECFLYVCEQLSDNGFRRLLKFNTAGKARFRTWLGTVVFNLCVDWHRREFGRATLSPAISALPAFDQSVYRLVIEQGMDKESVFQNLRSDFPDLTRDLLTRSVGRIFSLMTPRQRWQASVQFHGRKQVMNYSSQHLVEGLSDQGLSPESSAESQQTLEELQEALALLPAKKRLLLYWRFEEGLSLSKIAELNRLGDSNRAWREIQSALGILARHMNRKNFARNRK